MMEEAQEQNNLPQEQEQKTHQLSLLLEQIQEKIETIIIGQHEMVELLLAGLLANGHILLEGVPGVAKTLTAKLLAKLVDAEFSRIQFTPDLMPSDVLGTSIFNPQTATFQFKAGPIFSNMILIDEINRAPAKTQAALFEVMEERQATVDGTPYKLQEPFMVIATQNPIEHEGTYRLPEAQLDRFMMKITVDYPSLEHEIKILEKQNIAPISETVNYFEPLISPDVLAEARKQIRAIHVERRIIEFIAKIIWETRNDKSLYVGASPRASIALLQVAKAISVLNDRNFVIPEDVIRACNPVLRHRLILTPEREMEGINTDDVLKEIIDRIEIPR